MKTLLPILLATLAASAAQARPMKALCESMEPFRKLADLRYVKPLVRVKPKSASVKPQEVVFTIESKSGPVEFKPAPDGSIVIPFTDALCAENPNVAVNQPEGTVGFEVSIEPQIPAARAVEYRELDALRREWDEAVSRQGFVMRTLAPSPKGYRILFEPGKPASAEVRLPQGARKFDANAEGQLDLPFESSWTGANPAVVFSEVPKRIGLRFKG